MTPIQNISTMPMLPGTLAGKVGAPQGGPSFKEFLLNSIQEVNSMQSEADRAVEKLVTGGNVTPAEVLTAVQKADIAFNMMVQIRNKMVDAFQEVQKLQI
ncbi:MAG: flagellar hook-basal body complex protein FliE [Thermoguttaceae bacterium]|jgi:flagellar hook-basal body complex protein FliE